jgi:hypothetical protein
VNLFGGHDSSSVTSSNLTIARLFVRSGFVPGTSTRFRVARHGDAGGLALRMRLVLVSPDLLDDVRVEHSNCSR